MTQSDFLNKYANIIKEEVNIKDLSSFDQSFQPKKVYKPIGSQLSAKFGKDTGQIIANGKQGNIRELWEEKIEVFSSQGNSWILEPADYEVAYEGLDAENIAIEGDLIVELDLEITPELQREGIAREISRFLNQMRKDADFAVEDKLYLNFETDSNYLGEIVQEYCNFLQNEALLLDIQAGKLEWNVQATFESGSEMIHFSLSK